MPHNPYNLRPATREDELGLLGHLPGLGDMPRGQLGYDPMQKVKSGFMVQTPIREEPVPIEWAVDAIPEILMNASALIDPSGEAVPNPLNEPESGAVTPLLGPISAADLALETGLLGLGHMKDNPVSPIAALALGIGGRKGLKGVVPKGMAESKTAGWLSRVGPRLRGLKRKFIHGKGRPRYPNETFFGGGPSGTDVKTVAYAPKSELKFNPYEEFRGTWPDLSLTEMENALDLPKALRWSKRRPLTESENLAREGHRAELIKTFENKFNDLQWGPPELRERSLMTVLENRNVPMIDMDYMGDYMHPTVGAANIEHAGQAINAVKRLASQEPESLWDLYLTAGGARAFNIGKRQGANPLHPLGSKFLDDPAVDKWYSGYSKERDAFATRITPKGEREADFIAQQVARIGTGKTNPLAEGLIREMHDNYIKEYLLKYGMMEGRFGEGFLGEFNKQLGRVSTQQQLEMLKYLNL